MTLKERFIEVLKQDIAHFDEAADNLESLIPHLAGIEQKEQAFRQVEGRRLRAQELRLLLERTQREV